MDIPSNQTNNTPSESVETPSESVETSSESVETPSVLVTGNDKSSNAQKRTAWLQIVMQSLPIWVVLFLALFCGGKINPNEICENLLAMMIIDLGTMTSAIGEGLNYGSNTKPIFDSTLATVLLLLASVFYMILRLDRLVTLTRFFYAIVVVGIFFYYYFRVNGIVERA